MICLIKKKDIIKMIKVTFYPGKLNFFTWICFLYYWFTI